MIIRSKEKKVQYIIVVKVLLMSNLLEATKYVIALPKQNSNIVLIKLEEVKKITKSPLSLAPSKRANTIDMKKLKKIFRIWSPYVPKTLFFI